METIAELGEWMRRKQVASLRAGRRGRKFVVSASRAGGNPVVATAEDLAGAFAELEAARDFLDLSGEEP